ncbi:chaperone DnaJ-domain superfamily protein [Klebsormidium nitens]|uniref:Chaperone DnaJ-domain superfamily protein n=1 Tax=Klebsormidium nitens TaxID=105231 RepID=A0A1Y1IK37_KLENI|nr:chaperone DnaJ-domain superfamily protein [Klebsormidium nitens]|eukprot:GAQ91200.1 chaperone DnaJ-domain superfamily protein [Klebsormidium nitens]
MSKRDHHTRAKASKEQWTLDQSPYETLGVQGDVSEEGIKTAYRNLVKIYHPDVYQGTEDGEPAGARFIRIQAAYELLMDREARGNYDRDHKRNPFMASEAWQAYVARKKKAFEQRGDVAATAWAEVQRHEMQVKARQMAKQKMDPEEERRLVAKEVQLKAELFDRTSKRHMLVLKKRDLAKRRAGEDEKKLLVQKLLLEEGFELADED